MFIVVQHYAKPYENVNTSTPEWNRVPNNVDMEEKTYITKRVSNSEFDTASFVIDLFKNKVTKNRFHENVPNEKVLSHYIEWAAKNYGFTSQ